MLTLKFITNSRKTITEYSASFKFLAISIETTPESIFKTISIPTIRPSNAVNALLKINCHR